MNETGWFMSMVILGGLCIAGLAGLGMMRSCSLEKTCYEQVCSKITDPAGASQCVMQCQSGNLIDGPRKAASLEDAKK